MQIDPTSPMMIVGPAGPVQSRQPATPANVPGAGLKQPGRPAPVGNIADPVQAVRELSEVIEPFNIDLKFSKDAETGTIVIQMIDKKSGEELQQIPDRATLHVAATLRKLQGKILNCKA